MSGWWRVLFFASCFLLGYALARKGRPGSSVLGFREVTYDMVWLRIGRRWMVTLPVFIRGRHLVFVWPFIRRFNKEEARPWQK